ncbi:MAG: helix-turn-helix transcriptional regulator [Lachnospiraceae bacterium]|jgi:transcriptional regulator with XRE-family HTH domain|nr:helix-turn-helix transcriptional regulator [Lachnospiraceae bacterium]
MGKQYPVIDIDATAKNIKNIMYSRNITVKDIQRFLGLETPQSVYHWLNGRNMPTIDNLYALSELFQMPIDTIIIGNRKFNTDQNKSIIEVYENYICRGDLYDRMRFYLVLNYFYISKNRMSKKYY